MFKFVEGVKKGGHATETKKSKLEVFCCIHDFKGAPKYTLLCVIAVKVTCKCKSCNFYISSYAKLFNGPT